MKQLVMTPAGLGAVRFHISPVNQVGGLLRLIASQQWHPQQSRFARHVRPLLANPSLAILAELTPPGGVGNLPIVHLRPEAGARGLEEELATIESLPLDTIHTDLERSGRTGPHLRRSLERGTVGPDVAEAIRLLWREALADEWPRIEAGLCAEIARCGELIAHRGLGSALEDIHPRLHWVVSEDGPSLILDKPIDGHREVGTEGLFLMPNAFLVDEPMVTVEARTDGVSYAARLPERDGTAHERSGQSPMAQLIGSTRSRVLDALVVPLTTTALSGQLDLAPSTVSTHLKVLHTAGLVVRRREGQRVLYARAAS